MKPGHILQLYQFHDIGKKFHCNGPNVRQSRVSIVEAICSQGVFRRFLDPSNKKNLTQSLELNFDAFQQKMLKLLKTKKKIVFRRVSKSSRQCLQFTESFQSEFDALKRFWTFRAKL